MLSVFNYNPSCQDRSAGPFLFGSLREGKVPSLLNLRPGAILADVQDRFRTGGFCFTVTPRQQAAAEGKIKFIGRPHVCGESERYVNRGRCVKCTLTATSRRAKENRLRDYEKNRERRAQWLKANTPTMRAAQARWRVVNRDKALNATKRWRENHPERARELSSKYYQQRDPEQRQEATRQWRARNRNQVRLQIARRKIAKLQRTPSYANIKAIEAMYLNCPAGFHVDHVIPLRGKLVSGLHIETNLQYLTKAENQLKNNRFEPIFTSGSQGEICPS